MHRAIVAIDGPAGAGKTTVSHRVALALGYRLLDTGAIYRSLALAARRADVAWEDSYSLAALAATLPIRFETVGEQNRVFLGDEDVSTAIRAEEMSRGASQVSAHPAVREALLGLQRDLASGGGVVMEGRDIGTVVLPHAEAKIFLTATLDTRAQRRMKDLEARGEAVDFEQLRHQIAERDHNDRTRAVAPLRQAADARLVDTSDRTIAQVVDEIVNYVHSRLGS
ncbi:MAG: (d)CMP kinase [Myxococcales bacterium]|nr:(d)CMP kinase [Myxococcales bacterium]